MTQDTTEKSFQKSLSFHKTICRFFVLAIVAVLRSTEAASQDDVGVNAFLDRDSGGWNDKRSDYAFLSEVDGCRIKWNAVEEKDGTRYLVLHRTCNIPFAQQARIHLAILKQINERWKIASFRYIAWDSFCNKNDWSWCIPIAEASLRSEEFSDLLKRYPQTATVYANHLFIKLANQTDSYKPLADIFRAFGVTIELKGVQKVFGLKLKETPFYEEFLHLNIKDNSLVIYDAGMTYFRIIN